MARANDREKWQQQQRDLAAASPELAEHRDKDSEMPLVEGAITDVMDPNQTIGVTKMFKRALRPNR